MQLNHLDLQVYDVTRSTAFFERYFGLQVQSNAASSALVILTDEQGFVLVLQRSKQPTETYPEGFHLGFLVDDEASVHVMHARACADGTPVSDVIVNGRGTMIYLSAPEGYFVEVSCQKHRFGKANARALPSAVGT